MDIIIEISKKLLEKDRIIDIINTSPIKPIEGGRDIFKKQIKNQQKKKTGDIRNIPLRSNLLRLFNQE
jgi:hypothetical protein